MDDNSKSGSDTYSITKLTEYNYRSWSQQLKWILDEKDLLEVVYGTEKPIPPTTQNAEAIAKYETDLKEWNRSPKVKKARSIIGATVSESVMVYIEGMGDPAEMWKVLEEKYNPKTKVTLLQTMRNLMTAEKSSDILMEDHLQHVQRLKRRLEEQGEVVSDNIYCSILLNSVRDEEWKVAVNILESTENLTPMMVINRLLEEERKINGGEKPKTALSAVLQNAENRQCFYCGQAGHIKRNCPVRKYRQSRNLDERSDGDSDEPMKAKFAF